MIKPENVFAKYASKAGFTRAPLEKLEGAPILDGAASYWRASYAQILVLTLAKSEDEHLRAAVKIGQNWLDISCMKQEREKHRVVDAYLLVILGSALPESLFGLVHDIELDPVCCRKHIAWPYEGDDEDIVWRRLLRVTSLGLPTSPSSSGMTNSPKLTSEFQKALLDDIKELKGLAAARQHSEVNTNKERG